MSVRGGWTLIEVLVIITIIALVIVIALPSLNQARQRVRLATCAMQMHHLHTGLLSFAAVHDSSLPPFGFSSLTDPSLPLSGHWGGVSRLDDPMLLWIAADEENLRTVNLSTLVETRHVDASGLICPGAGVGGDVGYFAHTGKFSTYCMRFPYSRDLFRNAPDLAWNSGGLLGVYLGRSFGGEMLIHDRQTVPLVSLRWRYRTEPEVACGDGEYTVMDDAMFADAFWYQRHEEAGETPFAVNRAWCHGDRFNVAYGGGAVRTIRDDGTLAACSAAPSCQPEADGVYHATNAERIWQYFDARR